MLYYGDENKFSELTKALEVNNKETKQYQLKFIEDNKEFEAELVLLDEPVYEGCGNDEWSVKFSMIQSDYSDDEEFYATMIDENTLLLQHLYPFDGTQGVSYQTYTRK